MNGDLFIEVIEELTTIENDECMPKNIRVRIKKAIASLNNEEVGMNIRIDKSLEELGDLTEDPNVPNYARTQILTLVSLLESRE